MSVDRTPGGVAVPHFEPSARGPWSRVREWVPAADVLDSQGDIRGDGWPVVYANPADGRPEVVWSAKTSATDIVLSVYGPLGWIAPITVSRTDGHNTLPSVTVDAGGNRFVAWNRARSGRNSVVLNYVTGRRLLVGDSWELSARRNDARRPSLAASLDGSVYVAYEEQDNSGSMTVAIAIDRATFVRDADQQVMCGGENSPVIARVRTFTTGIQTSTYAADVRVHAERGHVWVDWIHQPGRLAWTELVNGTFSDMRFDDYTADTGDEPARRDIRATVLGY